MKPHGWLKLWRGLWLKQGVSVRPKPGEKARRMEAWLWLLSQAAYEPEPEHTPPLLPGQVAVSRGDICAYTNWSDSAAKNWLIALERDGRIRTDGSGRVTVITIVNWHLYQSGAGGSRTGDGQATDRPRTSHGQANATNDNGNSDEKTKPRTGHGQATDRPRTGQRVKEEENQDASPGARAYTHARGRTYDEREPEDSMPETPAMRVYRRYVELFRDRTGNMPGVQGRFAVRDFEDEVDRLLSGGTSEAQLVEAVEAFFADEGADDLGFPLAMIRSQLSRWVYLASKATKGAAVREWDDFRPDQQVALRDLGAFLGLADVSAETWPTLPIDTRAEVARQAGVQ